MENQTLYFNRDISWLSFNARVLDEASDRSLPLYERIKFLAIYSSNLDEFYRVRVATINSLQKLKKEKLNKKLNFDPEKLHKKIKTIVANQLDDFGSTLRKNIIPELKKEGLNLVYNKNEIPEAAYSAIRSYFQSRVLSYLQPVVLGSSQKAFLQNTQLYLLLKLTHNETRELFYAYINIPSPPLERYFTFQFKNQWYFIFLDDIIRLNINFMFPGYSASEAFSIKLNRDADLHIDDEFTGDLIDKIRTHLSKRKIGAPSRLLYDRSMPFDMVNTIMDVAQVSEDELVSGGRYHNLNDFFTLPNPKKPKLEIKKWQPIKKRVLENELSIFKAIESRDILLHFPYHSYDYVLRFFNEAAVDPNVTEINATFYRVASDSFIVNALISAARNGKKVHAFVEVKARFDEENNLKWASQMEQAGIKITYSIPGLKVHAKAVLVNKTESNGNKIAYGFLGTGNFNEKTANIYTDHGLLTTDKKLTTELKRVFRYLYNQTTIPRFKYLLVSQFNIRDQFNSLIDNEIENRKSGKKGHILIKVNNLEDRRMIDRLYQASLAGVEITIIVRSICCLIPGLKPYGNNIKIVRLVDRYLEHSRIFVFHNRGREKVFMGSADWMKRNLSDRIEVVFPINDDVLKKEVIRYLAFQLHDNTKARLLDKNLHNNVILNKNGAVNIRAQYHIYNWLKNKES